MRIIKLRFLAYRLPILSLEALQRAAKISVQVISGKACQRVHRHTGSLGKRSLKATDLDILFVFYKETYRGSCSAKYLFLKNL